MGIHQALLVGSAVAGAAPQAGYIVCPAPTLVSQSSLVDVYAYEFTVYASCQLHLYPDGSAFYKDYDEANLSIRWWDGPGALPGADFWVRLTTLTGINPVQSSGSGWQRLNADVYWIFGNSYDGTGTGTTSTYTLEFATDAAGSNIVATVTPITVTLNP